MRKVFGFVLSTVLALGAGGVYAAEPEAGKMFAFQIPFTADLGVMSAADLLETPAGKAGSIVARDGHFFTADGKRIRFWGVNTCFAGDFPTHEQADQIAPRLASLGVNCVRLHHMDSQKFPSGIFADDKLETLSPEALDRLDYFVAALKKHGVYVNVNLHVSRKWSRTHDMPNADKLDMDKIVDLFYPEFIAAQKQYARDLLTHVNKYTGNKYADEPAVALVEINNENTFFLWGGDRRIEDLPEPYGPYLTKLWNEWLTKKYGTRDKLKEAWNQGAEPVGKNLLRDASFEAKPAESPWHTEVHEGANISIVPPGALVPDGPPRPKPGEIVLSVGLVTPTSWHVQFSQPRLAVKKGQFYTVHARITASPLQPGGSGRGPYPIDVSIGQAHEPWSNLGFSKSLALKEGITQDLVSGFTATADDDNARLSFTLGKTALVYYTLSAPLLAEGGQVGLGDNEDAAKGTVGRRQAGAPVTAARSMDWFDFVQQMDESFFVSMREFLKKDLGVKPPVTGTTGLGALGTLSQSKLDFVDAHSYWDHPQFPRRSWDSKDWLINNKPMVNNPAGSTFWGLAATRVAGKPFTVTEYNHAAPNEWQAECVPMIASYAAAQDWDAVFLFAYSHNGNYDKGKMDSFFDIEGNTLKLAHMATAARLFLMPKTGAPAMPPLVSTHVRPVDRAESLRVASQYYFQLWDQIRSQVAVAPAAPHTDLLRSRFAISFDGNLKHVVEVPVEGARLDWSAAPKHYAASAPGAAVFVGSAGEQPVDIGPLRIEHATTPFFTLILVATDGLPLEKSKRMLLSVAARGENEGMKWDAARRSVSNQWGQGPMRVEPIDAELSLAGGPVEVHDLLETGKRRGEAKAKHSGERGVIPLGGQSATLWYEITR